MFKRVLLLLSLTSLALNAHGKRPEPWTLPIAPELPVEVVLPQQELGVDVSNTGAAVTAAAVGGILGALIGSAISNQQVANAEKRVGEMRDLLVDYDFNARFEQALRGQLAESGLSPNLEIHVSHAVVDPHGREGKPPVARANVLYISPRYAVSANFETLFVSMSTSLMEHRIKRNGKLKQVWKGNHNYSYVLPMEKVQGSGASEDASRWTGLGATRLQGLLDEGIAQLMAMMAYDLSAEGLADAQAKNKGRTEFQGKTYPGRKVREGEGWIWVRVGNGLFATVQGVRPLSRDWVEQATQLTSTAPGTPAALPIATDTSVDVVSIEPQDGAAGEQRGEDASTAEAAVLVGDMPAADPVQ